jgi:hypothetical protein
MIKAQTIAEILSLYKKHGWILRRVLLSDALKNNLKHSSETVFGDVEINSSKIDGLWFSRISPHGEAWELRRLSDAPFALVEVLHTDIDELSREKILQETEQKILAAKS